MNTTEQLNRQLFAAVEEMKGADRVRELLAAGARANARMRDGTSILHKSLYHDEADVEVVRALLEAGADPNVAPKAYSSPLFIALENAAEPELVRLLLGAGAKLSDQESVSDMVLDAETLSLLREYGIGLLAHSDEDVEWDEIGPPEEDVQATRELLRCAECADPLSESVVRSCLERGAGELSAALRKALVWGPKPSVVRLLLSAGADPNERDAAGSPALHRAVEYHAVAENVRALLEAGAFPDALNLQMRNPRAIAELPGQGMEYRSRPEEIVQMLREAEVSFEPGDSTDVLIDELFRAIRAECEESVLGILDAGAAVNARRYIHRRCKSGTYSALDYALLCHASPVCIRALLAAGALPSRRSLSLAVDGEHKWGTIEALLAAGADADGQDECGLTPLMHAAISGDSIRSYRALLEAGAAPNTRDKNDRTVLHHLLEPCGMVNIAALELLLDAGADPNAADNCGRTPLMLAMMQQRAWRPIVPILLASGADVHAHDTRGRTPLHYAWSGEPHHRFFRAAAVDEIRALLAAGASCSARDGRGETPRERMRRKGDVRKAVRQMLQEPQEQRGGARKDAPK